MPQRSNIVGDLGTTKIASDSYDVDNVYLTDEGWVYRHYKRADKSKFWDEIIVAGQVPASDSPEATNPPKLGTVESPTFESGDTLKDFEYSPLYGNDVTGGGVPDFSGGTPTPPTPPTPPTTGPVASVALVGTTSTQGDGSITATSTTSANGTGLTVTYDVASGVASNLAIAVAGSGYEEGDSFTVDGDTGVTGTVTI